MMRYKAILGGFVGDVVWTTTNEKKALKTIVGRVKRYQYIGGVLYPW